jgi:putative drug exporter of the RND superfamily
VLRFTATVMRAPRLVLGGAVIFTVLAALFGAPVADKLGAGGFRDPGAESARGSELLAQKFGQSDQQMGILIDAPNSFRSAAASKVARDLVHRLANSPYVYSVASAWTSEPAVSANLVSKDGKSGLIIANLRGGESQALKHAKALSDELIRDRDGVTVRAGGSASIYAQVNEQSTRDLLLMESVAIPLSFVALVWVFGGVLAAAVPVAVGVVGILGTLAILRLITFFADVSVFALNLSSALGLALAIDYTLLIVSRYRDELAAGSPPDQALLRTMVTAGRTVLFSASTIGLSMSTLLVFPMYFMRSFAYAGVATAAFAALASVVITPAVIVVLGNKLNAWDARSALRRAFGRGDATPKDVESQFWYTRTKYVMHHAVLFGVAVVAVLGLLGLPFLGVKWGFGDDRLLPASAQGRQVGDQLRSRFASDPATQVPIVVPDADGINPAGWDQYAADLSRAPDVSEVASPTGNFVGGNREGPPTAPTGQADGSAFLTVISSAPLYTAASDAQLDRLHHVATPSGRAVLVTGVAQTNRDSVNAINDPMPVVLALIAVVTLVLLFLLTGSVILPIKALVLNGLSLTATFGALVWVFQDGHLDGLGTTPTGTLIANLPVLLFCIAFGLSMDYEVFLLSRIREYWLKTGQAHADNDESVAQGVARTGRVITAAALVMSISFIGLAMSQVSFMRMLGVGLTIAVLMDATLVRLVLVPAFMHLFGRLNWWAPSWLAPIHARLGISDADDLQPAQLTTERKPAGAV